MKICWKSLLIGVLVGSVGMHLYMAKYPMVTPKATA
jgi:hypothetical protein